jgi:hypothetical protein
MAVASSRQSWKADRGSGGPGFLCLGKRPSAESQGEFVPPEEAGTDRDEQMPDMRGMAGKILLFPGHDSSFLCIF